MTHRVTKIAEYGIIINKNNRFLMLKFSRETNPSEKWIFPGGRLDNKENPKEGLIREIKEETGLNVEILFPCDVAAWGMNDDHRYAVFFVCRLKGSSKIKLCKEHQDFNWFSFDQLDYIEYHDKSFKKVLLICEKLLLKQF